MTSLRYPKRKHLKKGNILPVYQDWKSKEIKLGYAKLIKRVESNQEELPYVFTEVGSRENREPHAYIYSHQRWVIEYVDPYEYDDTMSKQQRWKYLHQKGFRTAWNLSYFITVSSTYPSGTEDW